MQIIENITPLKSFLLKKKKEGSRVGLVPTMGALHKGHMSLVKKCRDECDLTVVSIFVNPAQFNKKEDLVNYPVTLKDDCTMLEAAGADVVFIPTANEMYPEPVQLALHFPGLDNVLEGKFRPGHFSGVAIVVSKFFHLVSPDTAFFGQKDLQQIAVIKRLVNQLSFPLELATVPTVRDEDGLAFSSRNKRLTGRQRADAPVLYRVLNRIRKEILAGRDVATALEAGRKHIEGTADDIKVEYLELVSSWSMELHNTPDTGQEMSLCVAAYFGKVRLIDNIFLK